MRTAWSAVTTPETRRAKCLSGLGRSESRQASQADAAHEDAPREAQDASVAEQTAVALAPTEFEAPGTESSFLCDAAEALTARTPMIVVSILPVPESEHEALVADDDIFGVDESHLRSSNKDHKPEGTLDSACNRSLGGFPRVETYVL